MNKLQRWLMEREVSMWAYAHGVMTKASKWMLARVKYLGEKLYPDIFD